MRYTVVATGGEEPLSLIEAKAQLRVEHTEEDTLISGLVSAARASAEHHTGLVLVQKRIKEYLDGFPNGGEAIELSFAPVRTVQSVQYIDDDGNTQTWAAANYTTDLSDGMYSRITEAYNVDYPDTRDQTNSVWITYDVGPTSFAEINEAVKQGMLLEVSEWYDKRENGVRRHVTAAERLYQAAKRIFL